MPDIKDLRGVYQDNSCFVAGNGPSLRQAPFDKLKNEYTFGMNLIGLIDSFTDWLPDFYVLTGVRFDNGTDMPNEVVLKAIRGAKLAFIWDRHRSNRLLKPYQQIVWIPVSHAGHYQPGAADNDWWSDDASQRVSKYGTTLFAACQIAVYLGFSPIYLIGADGYVGAHKADEPDCNHFHPQYHKQKSANWPPVANAFTKHTHQIVLANCQRLGVEIYDATQSKGLGILPKVELAEVLK